MLEQSEKTIKVSALKPFERYLRWISGDAFNQLRRSLLQSGHLKTNLDTKETRVIEFLKVRGTYRSISTLQELKKSSGSCVPINPRAS